MKSRTGGVPAPGDVIGDLGPMAFASRLKRLHERLIRDVGRLYDGLGFPFEPRWFLLFYSLHDRGPASITALAATLSQSHASVNQVAGELLKAGLITESRHRGDDRKRLLKLSARGRSLAARMVPIWQEVGKATSGLFGEAGFDMIAGLAATERALEKRSIYDRVRVARGESLLPPVEIVDYRPAFKKHFRDLNYAWLRQYFTIEPEDEKLLSDPRGRIINQGGAVLFARLGDEIVGTCALLRHSPTRLELAKMAVDARYRGQGVGHALALAAIEKAARLGYRKLLVLTSDELATAIRLYRRLGFVTCPMPEGMASRYQRRTSAMELKLTPKSRTRARR